MRRENVLVGVASVGMLVGAGAADAAPVRLNYTLQQGSSQGFAFSLLHVPDASKGAQGFGVVAYRVEGTFTVDYDADAGTLDFVDFAATLFNDSNVNTARGAEAGSLSLVDGALSRGAGDLVSGALTLEMTLNSAAATGGPGAGEVTFAFPEAGFNQLANRFDSETFALGLWGATPDVFGAFQPQPIGDTGLTSLGADIRGIAPVMEAVPLPTPVLAGAGGLAAVALGRRRRLRA